MHTSRIPGLGGPGIVGVVGMSGGLIGSRAHNVDTVTVRAVIAGEWLHCTIIGLRDSSTVGADELAAVLAGAQEALTSIPPFDTPPGQPRFWREAVVFDLSPCPELTRLDHELIERPEGLLRTARPTSFTPHVTFSYVHDEGDAQTTIDALADQRLLLPSFRVDTVYLLDVLREPGPERGWYSWDVVGQATLRG